MGCIESWQSPRRQRCGATTCMGARLQPDEVAVTVWFKVVMFSSSPIACVLGITYGKRPPSLVPIPTHGHHHASCDCLTIFEAVYGEAAIRPFRGFRPYQRFGSPVRLHLSR